jgi:hypothetical protein
MEVAMGESTFLTEVEEAIKHYESAIGHAASRTRTMIAQHGEVEALSRLMISPDLQQGFKVLRDREQLHYTFEAVVTRHPHLFKSAVVEAAQWRLDHPHQLL